MRFAVDAHAIGRHLTGNEVYVRSLLNAFGAQDNGCEFVAYVSEGLRPVYISEGAHIIADPEHWNGWKWNGRESLRFYADRTQYYVDRKTFLEKCKILN